MHTEMMISHLWRTAKRGLAIALIGLVVGVLAVPETSLAATHLVADGYAPSGDLLATPSDGVGDSPIMP